jgi:SPP1 gp7 family putative phage head morphogenesis protein
LGFVVRGVNEATINETIRNTLINGSTIQETVTNFVADFDGKVTQQLRMGINNGETISELTQRVRGVINKKGVNAQTIARTVQTAVSAEVRETTFDENSDVVKAYEWVSTLDTRTSDICKSLDGEVYDLDDPKRRKPPAHPNALMEGSRITTKRGLIPIEHVEVGDEVLTHKGRYKKVYSVLCKKADEKMYSLKYGNNASLSVSESHPILTKGRGWIDMRELTNSDVIFQNFEQFAELPSGVSSSLVEQAILCDSHNMKTTTSEELVSYGIFSSTTGVSSSVNLKNSIPNNEIGDVSIESHLKFKNDTEIIKKVKDISFVKRGIFSHVFGFRFNGFNKCVMVKERIINLHPLRGFRAIFSVLFGILRAPVILSRWFWDILCIVSDAISFRLGLDSVPLTVGIDCGTTDSKFTFNKSDRLSKSEVLTVNKFDNKILCKHTHNDSPFVGWVATSNISIVDVKSSEYVYNLSVEDDETYLAEGVLVHNCRSTIVPVLKSWKELGIDAPELSAGTRRDMDGKSISAKADYGEWLKGQSEKVQNEALGEAKAKLFRDNNLDMKDFVNRIGEPLPAEHVKANLERRRRI